MKIPNQSAGVIRVMDGTSRALLGNGQVLPQFLELAPMFGTIDGPLPDTGTGPDNGTVTYYKCDSKTNKCKARGGNDIINLYTSGDCQGGNWKCNNGSCSCNWKQK